MRRERGEMQRKMEYNVEKVEGRFYSDGKLKVGGGLALNGKFRHKLHSNKLLKKIDKRKSFKGRWVPSWRQSRFSIHNVEAQSPELDGFQHECQRDSDEQGQDGAGQAVPRRGFGQPCQGSYNGSMSAKDFMNEGITDFVIATWVGSDAQLLGL